MKSFKLFICCTFLLTCSIPAFAEDEIKQYVRSFQIGDTSAAILLIGYKKDNDAIEELLTRTTTEGKKLFTQLDAQTSDGEVALLNANAGKETQVSHTLLELFKASKQIFQWSDGAFDIMANSPTGNSSMIRINEKKSLVTLPKGSSVNFGGILHGFIADGLVQYISDSGMNNAMVKIGKTFRGLGRSLQGPWTLQVQDDSGTYAHRAVNVQLANSGLSVVGATEFKEKSLIDPRTKAPVTFQCRGVTVAMPEAVYAAGIAHAAFVLGPEAGFQLISNLKNARGVVVSNSGEFHRSPGF